MWQHDRKGKLPSWLCLNNIRAKKFFPSDVNGEALQMGMK
jgi:hypothetical protein